MRLWPFLLQLCCPLPLLLQLLLKHIQICALTQYLKGPRFIYYLRSLVVTLGLPGTNLSDQLQRGLVL